MDSQGNVVLHLVDCYRPGMSLLGGITHRVTPTNSAHVDASTRAVAAISMGMGLAGLVALGMWAVLAPSHEHPKRYDYVFESYEPSATFPMLSTDRQRLFVVLIGVGAVTAGVSAAVLYRAMRNLSPRVVRAQGLVAQVPLACVAVGALLLDGRQWSLDILRWGHPKVIAGLVVGVLACSTTCSSLRQWRLRRSLLETVAAGVACIAAVPYAVAILETPNSTRDLGNNGYLVNELLAPSVGSHPLFDYSATYSNLWGYAAMPFVKMGMHGPTVVVVILMIGTVLTLAATFLLLRTVLGWRLGTVATVLVIAATASGRIPATIPTPNGELIIANDTYSYHQLMPLRFLGVMVMANLALLGLRWSIPKSAVLVGFIGTFVAINNPDFGTLSFLAAVVAVGFWPRHEGTAVDWLKRFVSNGRYVLVGAVTAISMLSILCVVLARRLPNLWGMTAGLRSYAGGLIALPMGDLFDFHVLVVGTYLVAVLVGTATLLHRIQTTRIHATSLALQFIGLVGLGSLVYYSNRPVLTTLVASQFFTWTICLALLCARLAMTDVHSRSTAIVGAATLIAVSFTVFSQVVSPPDMGAELRRLREGRTDTGSILLGSEQMVPVIERHSDQGEMVAILAAWPKTIAAAAGVRDLVPFSTMPFVTYPDLDMLTEALLKHPEALVYVDESHPFPETLRRLDELGYRPIADGAVSVLAVNQAR